MAGSSKSRSSTESPIGAYGTPPASETAVNMASASFSLAEKSRADRFRPATVHPPRSAGRCEHVQDPTPTEALSRFVRIAPLGGTETSRDRPNQAEPDE